MKMERAPATYMTLRYEAASQSAISFCSRLAHQVWKERGKLRPSPFRRFTECLSAIVAELFKAEAIEAGRYCYRSMDLNLFRNAPYGYRNVRDIAEGLRTLGLIDTVKGAYATEEGDRLYLATRFRPTTRLLREAEAHGIRAAEWRAHFRVLPRPAAINEPVALRSSSVTKHGRKYPGNPLPFDPDPEPVSTIRRQVDELNAFFSLQSIEPADSHYAFQRIFNQGDDPAFAWNKGGRLCSIGQSYQQMSSMDRKEMKLNGEPVVEIDIRASHLTILHAKRGISFDPGNDPYDVPPFPREIVKAWVTMTLGHDKFQRKWSDANKEKYRKEYPGRELQKDYPIRVVREAVLEQLPILADWSRSTIRWGDLQYLESCAIIGAVYELAMTHGVTALPVHDSIIVPSSKEGLATERLCHHFKKHIGVTPVLSLK